MPSHKINIEFGFACWDDKAMHIYCDVENSERAITIPLEDEIRGWIKARESEWPVFLAAANLQDVLATPLTLQLTAQDLRKLASEMDAAAARMIQFQVENSNMHDAEHSK